MDFSKFKKLLNIIFLRNKTILKILTKFMTKSTAEQRKEEKKKVMGMIYELFFMEPLYSSIARQRAPPVLVSHAFQLAL